MKLIYFASIDNGLLKIHNRKGFDKDVAALSCKEVSITIEKKKKQRSNEQNRYYWGCLIPIVQAGLKDMGHEVGINDTHEFLKANFCKKEIVDENSGEIYSMPQSTTELTTTGFMDFIAAVQKFGAEFLNINIPAPNEQTNAFN